MRTVSKKKKKKETEENSSVLHGFKGEHMSLPGIRR